MHPIHKHMSSRMKARKADERYDAKEAYNKNLSGKARLHYLENDIADKGMSMKAPMEMGHSPAEMDHSPAELKSPYKMGHSPAEMDHSPAEMKSPMEKGHESAKQEKKDLMKYNPVDDRAGSPADLKKKSSPVNAMGDRISPKKEYSIGEKLVGTAKNIGDYVSGAYNKSEILAGIGVTNPHGSKAERKHDLGKSKKAFDRAAKRKKEGSSFFMKSPMYDKGHEGDQDGHVHPRTQGEVDVMNKHGQALNKFIGKVNKFGPMSESQRSRVTDKINALQGQYNKTRDSIGNVHKKFDLKRDQEFEDLFGDKK